MRLTPGERRVSLSIGEFSEFRMGPSPDAGGTRALWRAQLGTAWHKEMEGRTRQTHPDARFEVSIKGEWKHRGWNIVLQGRIDQLIEEDGRRLFKEIKSTSRRLPMVDEELESAYPHYFAQLASYLVLDAVLKDEAQPIAEGELLFVSIHDGTTQVIELKDARRRFDLQLDVLCDFLEHRRMRADSLMETEFAPPFEKPREGQPEAMRDLRAAGNRVHTLCFEAPTGFGKTGVALEYGLQRLKDGLTDRIVYVTGKSTGQVQVMRQLEGMQAENPMYYMQMRSQGDFGLVDSGIDPDLTAITPLAYFEKSGVPDMEELERVSETSGVSVWEILCSCLPYAELWVADYNYVFAPDTSHVFEEIVGYDPGQTLLIVDEAHNLSERVCGAWSALLEAEAMAGLASELGSGEGSARLCKSLEVLSDYLGTLKKCDIHEPMVDEELSLLLDDCFKRFLFTPVDYDHLSDHALSELRNITRARRLLSREDMKRLVWSSEGGRVALDCIDASTETGVALKRFQQVLLMSATLSPKESFYADCGIDPESAAFIHGYAPWRDEAFDIMVDASVDTRYSERDKYLVNTARAIALTAGGSEPPLLVFFPSYAYADKVRKQMSESEPLLMIAFQPRGLPLEGQRQFIEEALFSSHVIFLVLGSSFSEAVDMLGGRVSAAVIVSPALPELNPRNNARKEAKGDKGFREVYQIPGIRKIRQAMGRLVRAPGHHAKILLHCRRFKQKDYRELIEQEFPVKVGGDDEAIREWLES